MDEEQNFHSTEYELSINLIVQDSADFAPDL